MNIYELENFMKASYPGSDVTVTLDGRGCSSLEVMPASGNAWAVYNKARVNIGALEPVYMPIDNHRHKLTFSELKEFIETIETRLGEQNANS